MSNGYGFNMTMPEEKGYQSPNRRLAQILLQQQANRPRRNRGNMGQITDLLRSGLGAYLMSKDFGQQQSAQDAFYQAAKGGDRTGGMAALEELKDNPYAKNRLQRMLMQQMGESRKQTVADKKMEADRALYKFQQENKAFAPQRLRPGVDVPFSQDVQQQKLAQQAAGRPSWGPMQNVPGMMQSSTGQMQAMPQTPMQRAQSELDVDLLKSQMEAKRGLPQAEEKAADTLKNIEDLVQHPGMAGVVGIPDTLSGAAYKIFGIAPAGTDEAGFTARLNQIGGQQFLQAFMSLKGGGQITETEGIKATNAMSRLMNTGQSEAEYRQSAKELTDMINRSVNRARTAAGQQPVSGAPVTRGSTIQSQDLQGGPQGIGGGSAANAVQISTDGEYDALPSGANFIGPDGQLRRKP